MKILRAGKHKTSQYTIDVITTKDGKMVWKDKKVSKEEWEKNIQQKH